MAHILCITSGLTGILYASFQMVKQLETAGYQVTYASPKAVAEKVTANGIAYRQLLPTNFSPCPPIPEFKGKLRKLKRLAFKFSHARQLRMAAIDALGMEEFKAVLADVAPDLVLIDVELHDHLMTCIANGVPTILLSQWYALWHRRGLPPLSSTILPGNGFEGSPLGLQLVWMRLKLKRWWIFSKQKWRSFGTDRRTVLKAYARKVGFSLRFAKENYWPGPFTYNMIPVLSMTIEAMEFPHRPVTNLHYIGAQVLDDRKDLQLKPDVEARLEQVFKQQKTKNRSLIYCSVSTFKSGDASFLKKIVAAVEERPDWLLIISLGGLLEADLFDEIPTNVFPFAWVPQLKVLAEADCSINHGGVHTINECIHFQVPMLVYSGKRSDQNGCAARVAYHQLGIMADKDKDDAETIELKIEQVLTNSIYQQNVRKMYQHYQQYLSEATVVKAVNVFLKSEENS